MDFLEFALYVWNFCSFTGESLVLYTFTLYGQNTRINYSEIKALIRDLYGDRFDSNHDAQEVIKALGKVMAKTNDDRGYITDKGNRLKGNYTFEEFKDFTRHHQVALFPLYTMQDTFKKALSSINWASHAIGRGESNSINIEDVVKNMKGNIIIIIIIINIIIIIIIKVLNKRYD